MECSWQATAHEDHEQRVLPDGCMDVVWAPSRGLHVAGPNTTAFVESMPAGTAAAGVRMRPGCGPALLGVVASAVRDAGPGVAELWGSPGARLEEAVAEAGTCGARIGLMLGWLAERARAAAPPDPLVIAAAARLGADPRLALPLLARELGIGERHLRRRLVADVGYGPKRLARVLRLQRALALAGAEPALGWAGVAYRAGYADQAHLTHDCRELAGLPPTELRPAA